jgi:hypothetical protein
MNTLKAVMGAVGMVILMVGCAGSQLEKRAAVEFDCPRESVTSERISGGQFLLRGCGKRAFYSCGETQCIRNSEITEDRAHQ